LSIPLEIRSIDDGSYISDSLVFTVQGRVGQSGLMDFTILRYYGTPAVENSCSGPNANSYVTESPIDFVSPDGVLWLGATGLIGLPTGADGEPGSGTPSFTLNFATTSVVGSFEIDTCCMTPANHIFYLDQSSGFIIPFTKGVVTIIDCACPCQGDPVCDSTSDVLDVVAAVNEAFRGAAAVADSQCPHISRVDINCDCVVDVLDVVGIVNRAFRGAAASPCNPCAVGCG
jgi:hypothetical protein